MLDSTAMPSGALVAVHLWSPVGYRRLSLLRRTGCRCRVANWRCERGAESPGERGARARGDAQPESQGGQAASAMARAGGSWFIDQLTGTADPMPTRSPDLVPGSR